MERGGVRNRVIRYAHANEVPSFSAGLVGDRECETSEDVAVFASDISCSLR